MKGKDTEAKSMCRKSVVEIAVNIDGVGVAEDDF